MIERLPLGAGDFIYLSPFVSDGSTPYDIDMQAAAIASLDDGAIRAEEERFKAALQPMAKRKGVRISHYDLREVAH